MFCGMIMIIVHSTTAVYLHNQIYSTQDVSAISNTRLDNTNGRTIGPAEQRKGGIITMIRMMGRPITIFVKN